MATRTDTLLAHCVMRAMRVGGVSKPEDATPWTAMKATPRASRVAAFIALWAQAMIDLDVDELGQEVYSEWAAESRATSYRRLADFRELWPEYETPNELARLIVREVGRTERGRPNALVSVAL